MNKTFKIKRNASGKTVACSELAKSHSSVASKALVAIAGMFAVTAVSAGEINSPQWISIGGENTTTNASASTETRPALEYAIGDNNTVNGAAVLRWTAAEVAEGIVTADKIGVIKRDDQGNAITGQLGALAIGSNNTATAGQNITVGFNNDTSAVNVEAITVIGSDNVITGYSQANLDNKIANSIKAGRPLSLEDAKLDNEGTIIIGDQHKVELSKSMILIGHKGEIAGTAQNAVGLGDETKILSSDQAVTIGRKTLADTSGGAVAIGSTATVSNAYGGTSLGLATKTTAKNGVALGSFSSAARVALTADTVTDAGEGATFAANQVYALDVADEADRAAIRATVKGKLGAVSVGNADATRQIINVAAGTEDSDAVNVSQLKAVANVAAQKATVTAGDNVTVTPTTNSTGGVEYKVTASDTTYKAQAGSDYVSVVDGPAYIEGTVGVKDRVVDMSDKSKEAIDKAITALQEIKVNVNGSQVSVINQDNPQVGFNQGKNIVLGSDANGNVTVSTADEVDFNKVTVGNVTIDATTGIDAGGTKITNVAAGTDDTDAVNVSQLNQVKNDLVTNITNQTAAAKTEVQGGENVTITEGKGANGQSVYTISAKDTAYKSVSGTDKVVITEGETYKEDGTVVKEQVIKLSEDAENRIDNAVQNIVSESIVVVKKGDTVTLEAPKTTVSGTGDVTVTKVVTETRTSSGVTVPETTYNVDLTKDAKDKLELAQTAVQTIETSIDGKVVNTLTKDDNRQNFASGKNIKLSTDANGSVVVSTTDDVEFQNVVAKSFKAGDVYISANEVNAGGNKVTNVAKGEVSSTSTDAVNGSQLYQTNQNVTNLNNKVDNIFGEMQGRIDSVRKDMSAGIAGVNAAAAIPQGHRAGQTTVGAGLGYFGEQAALAVGVHSISDSGRWSVKGHVNATTRGDVGAGVGISRSW